MQSQHLTLKLHALTLLSHVMFGSMLYSPLANAGMPTPPMYTLTELARLRLTDISFFLMLFIVGALIVRLIWNSLRTDFPLLPKMTIKTAILTNLMFAFAIATILTMISGARELMTPQAWTKQGLINRTKLDMQRQQNMEYLRRALFDYAKANNGKFPATTFDTKIPEKLWLVEDKNRYEYVTGLTMQSDTAIVAYEPEAMPAPRYVLHANGVIEKLHTLQLNQALNARRQ